MFPQGRSVACFGVHTVPATLPRSAPAPYLHRTGPGVRDASDASRDDALPMNSPLPPLSAADRGPRAVRVLSPATRREVFTDER